MQVLGRDLGRTDYQTTLAAMQDFHLKKKDTLYIGDEDRDLFHLRCRPCDWEFFGEVRDPSVN